MAQKYGLPEFLINVTSQIDYKRWVQRKAVAHNRRDKKRCKVVGTLEDYKLEIHKAVNNSHGYDFYTNKFLKWELLSKYRNDLAKGGRRAYKKEFWLLPTVDHVGDGEGRPEFVICGWRTNDSKSDMSYAEFIEMCQQVLEAAKDRGDMTKVRT